MATKYLNELKIRQVDSNGTPEIHQLKLRSGALDMVNINSNIAVDWANVSGKPTTATRWPAWSEVTSKPSTFAPSAHNHAWSNITSGIPAQATRWPTWSEVTSKPSTFAPSSHTHSEYAKALTTANGYQGITLNNGATADWVRTTSNGLIPYASGGASGLGTSGWPFNTIYGKTIYENGTALSSKYAPSAHNHAWSNITSGVPAQATRWPTWSEVTSKPTTATRWPTWSEVTSKPSTFTSVTALYSGSMGADSSATMTSMSGYTLLIVVMYMGSSSSTNRDMMTIPVANISYSTTTAHFSRISWGSAMRYGNFGFGSATNIRTYGTKDFWIKTIYGVK